MPTDPRDSRPVARKPAAGASQPGREERLVQALRDNLKKRKAQQRGRAGGQGGPREEPGGVGGGKGPKD